MRAIPTEYNGIKFRSRLESRWACFFDNCNWTWSYEPVFLDGWLPDFELSTIRDRKLFVEVKPIDLCYVDPRRFPHTPYKKVLKNLCFGDVLLLGTNPFVKDCFSCIGYLLQHYKSYPHGSNEDIHGNNLDTYGWRYYWDYACLKVDKKEVEFGLSPGIRMWDDWLNRDVGRKQFDDEEMGLANPIFDLTLMLTRS